MVQIVLQRFHARGTVLWSQLSCVISGNLLETAHWSVPHLKQSITIPRKCSNRQRGWRMMVAFSKNSGPWGFPRNPLKPVFHICINMFISGSLAGRMGIKTQAWLSYAAADSSQWPYNVRAILVAILWFSPVLFVASCWQTCCIQSRRKRGGKTPAFSSKSKRSPIRPVAGFWFHLLARTVTWPPSTEGETRKVSTISSFPVFIVKGRQRHLAHRTVRMFPQEANIVDGSEDGFFISGYLQSRLHEELG